jgi:hypothetical protein
MQQRLPPSVIRALAAVAALTFLAGLCLEQTALDFLQRHPYIVNLLSGLTGFSISALVVAIFFDRAITAERAEQWRSAAWNAAKTWHRHIHAIEALIDAPSTEPQSGEDDFRAHREHQFGLRADVLTDIVRARGGVGLLLANEARLPRSIPFREPGGEEAFIGQAQALADHVLDPIVKAFDAAGDPEVSQQVAKLRAVMRGQFPAGESQAFEAAQAICLFVLALRWHPNYLAYIRTWEPGHSLGSSRLFFKTRWFLKSRWPF